MKRMTLGERIRWARTGARLSQTELAGHVGVLQGAISAWERDAVAKGPSLTHGSRISDACGVSLHWLATGLGDPPAFEVAA